jgi:signal peptidase I
MAKPSPMDVLNASQCILVSEAVRRFGRIRLRVSGTSMLPVMRPGDLLTVESAEIADISRGEIVVFTLNGRLVCHRVTEKFTDNAGDSCEPIFTTRLVTRGDRMRRNDPLVSGSELLGRVTQIERGNRRVRIRTRLSAAEQVVCRLLRISDHATSLYLRVTAL